MTLDTSLGFVSITVIQIKKLWSTNILLSQNPNFFERLTEYHSKREESDSVQFKSNMLNQKRPSYKNKLGHAEENSNYTVLKTAPI